MIAAAGAGVATSSLSPAARKAYGEIVHCPRCSFAAEMAALLSVLYLVALVQDLFYGVDRANQGKVPLSAEAHKSEERVVYWDNCRFRMCVVALLVELQQIVFGDFSIMKSDCERTSHFSCGCLPVMVCFVQV